MLKVFLIWLLALIGTPDQPTFQTTSYYCREYDLVIDEGLLSRTNKICYLSPIKKIRKKHVLTVQTDSLTLRFGVLRTFPLATNKNGVNRGSYTGSQTFAVILGEPDQLYVIREEIYVEKNHEQRIRYYVFTIHPIKQFRTGERVEGHVLEASNKEICNH